MRVNGVEVEELRVQYTLVDGAITEDREVAVLIEGLGWFTLDDNNLWDSALPKFILEYDAGKGWNPTTVNEFLQHLRSTGVIQ